MSTNLSVNEYLEALKQGVLKGVKCKDCGFITAPPRSSCRNCYGQNFEIINLSGRGKITTFTTIFTPSEVRRGQGPYVVIVVELDEGPWIMGNLTGIDPTTASMDMIGKRVALSDAPLIEQEELEGDPAPVFELID
jgi:uncharacterized protein